MDDTDALLDQLIALEEAGARIDAARVRVLARLAARPNPAPMPDKEFVVEEIACAVRWSANHAAGRLGTAAALVHRLPDTLCALSSAVISYRHAEEIADAAAALDDAQARALEARVLPRAANQTPAELRRAARRVAREIDPHTDLEEHLAALLQRRVTRQPDASGMCWLNSYLPADGAQTVWTALQAAARVAPHPLAGPGEGDPSTDCRTADQRRADALVAICTAYLAGGLNLPVPTWHGQRPTVQVTVALSTLTGVDDQPGELAGYGPIPAAMARRIAGDPTGTWRRLVTDDVGRLVDYGRTRYHPPADLRDHVLARDEHCTRPGCQRMSRQCEIDHHLAWADGGTTDAVNLGPACARDHHLKHDADWSVQRLADGTVRWTTPSGRRYEKPPTLYPIDRTAALADDAPPF